METSVPQIPQTASILFGRRMSVLMRVTPNPNPNRNRNRNRNPPTLADPAHRRLPAHAGANASTIQALLPLLALDAVARGLHSWRSREKRCRAEYRLPPHSKTLPPGRRASGRRFEEVRRGKRRCRLDGGLLDAAPAILECGGKRYSARHRSQESVRSQARSKQDYDYDTESKTSSELPCAPFQAKLVLALLRRGMR